MMSVEEDSADAGCPLPATSDDTIQLAHGGGGLLMARLLETVFWPAFDAPEMATRHDAAVLDLSGSRCAFSTDSYVVSPLFFPGGDIGRLAINGTVNDLAMAGARARFISAGFIIEEGLPTATLRRVVDSMRAAALAAGVRIVAGDTKVVERGKADGLFINTAGVGEVVTQQPIEPRSVRPGDVILLSGDIGQHGMAVMNARESFGFETVTESDCAPLQAPVLSLLEAGIAVHCLRDLTRGGLASALVEIAVTGRIGVTIDEPAIPVRDDVRAACELLGLDPLYVANEGRFVAFVAPEDAARALDLLQQHEVSRNATRIGSVTGDPAGRVVARGLLGRERMVDMLSGEQLPRIC